MCFAWALESEQDLMMVVVMAVSVWGGIHS